MKRILKVVSPIALFAGACLTLSTSANARSMGAWGGNLYGSGCPVESLDGIKEQGCGTFSSAWEVPMVIDAAQTYTPIYHVNQAHLGDVQCLTCTISARTGLNCTTPGYSSSTGNTSFSAGSVTVPADGMLWGYCTIKDGATLFEAVWDGP